MLALHRVLLRWNDGAALDIESATGRLGALVPCPPAPLLVECNAEVAPDVLSQRGSPAICWRPDTEHLFQPLQLRENTDYLVDITLPLGFDEAVRRHQAGTSWPFAAYLATVFTCDPPKRWHSVHEGVRVTGRLNFGNYAGVANLTIREDQPVLLEVAPTKLGYFEDFQALLEDISEQFLELLLEIESPTSAEFSYADVGQVDPLILLFHLRRVMSRDHLPMAMETILQSPHSLLEIYQQETSPSDLVVPAPDLIATEASALPLESGGPLAGLFRGYTPRTLPQLLDQETRDTAENRYIKAFLENLLQETEALHTKLLDAKKNAAAREVASWSTTVGDWLSRPLWRDVSRIMHFPSNSQVLQKRQGYREVLQADLSLQLNLRLPWARGRQLAEGLDGDIRPVSELYEYWCYFALRRCLRNLCGPEVGNASSLVTLSGDGLSVNLRRGAQSKVTFTYLVEDADPLTVSLFYNRSFTRAQNGPAEWDGSYTSRFHPDYSVLIEANPANSPPQRHWLHFDAKYRLDFQQWVDESRSDPAQIEDDLLTGLGGLDEEQRDVYKRSDLYKMHTYRDAVLGSRGAYVLFPGTQDQEDIFIRYPQAQYRTSEPFIPSVGAFQLSPRGAKGQGLHLEEFLRSTLDQLSEDIPYQEELGLR